MFLRLVGILLYLFACGYVQAQYNETEPNDDFPNANPVVVNSSATITGVLGSGGDHKDHFRLSVTEYCKIKVSFSSTPGYSMSIGLYNASTKGLAVMTSFTKTGSDSVSFECASAGTYYILINDHILNTTPLPYTIEVELENILPAKFVDTEYNSEKDSAKWVTLQPTILPKVKQANIYGNLRYRSDPGNPDIEDWYKFVLDAPGSLEIDSQASAPNVSYSISLSSKGGSISQDLFSSQENFCLEPDTFFLRVVSGFYGGCFNYSFVIRQKSVLNSTQEIEPNNDISHANPFIKHMYARIGYNSYDQNGAGTNDDRDFFQLVTHEEGDLIIDIEPDSSKSLSYAVSLFSGNSHNLLPINLTGNPAQGDTVQVRLFCVQADTFYLRILNQGNCSPYHIQYRVEKDSIGSGTQEVEPNDNISQAQDISNDTSILASISHSKYANIPYIIRDNIDYFMLIPDREGNLEVTVTPEPGTSIILPQLKILDSLGNVLASASNDTILLSCVGKNPYYLSVEASCDQYRLEWSVFSDFETDQEPNDVAAQAIPFPIGTSVTSVEGVIGAMQPTGFYDAYDYYQVVMSASGNTKLWFKGEGGYGTLDIWSNAGDLRSSHQAVANDSVEIDLSCLSIDTFYISVSGTFCFGYRIWGQIETFLGNPDPEPNNTPATGIQVTEKRQAFGVLGGEVISKASLGDTRDYYMLVNPYHGEMDINVYTVIGDKSPLLVQLLATDGTTILESDTLWNLGSTQINYLCMQPDTLFLLVKPYLLGLECQVYSVDIQLGTSLLYTHSDVEPNDNEANAIPLSNSVEAEGLLGFFRYGIADRDYADYFTFDAKAGIVRIFFDNSYKLIDSFSVQVYSASSPNLFQFDESDLLSDGTYITDINVAVDEPLFIVVANGKPCGYYKLKADQIQLVGIHTKDVALQVYPIPTDHTVTVKGVVVSQLQLLDLQGRLVRQSSSAHMNVMDIAAGVYYLKIKPKGADFWYYRTIVKE